MTQNQTILTTAVGSYAMPNWLLSAPSSEPALTLRASRLTSGGVQISICPRMVSCTVSTSLIFDINHPETNAMIEYFLRPMAGIRCMLFGTEGEEHCRQAGTAFRRQPHAVGMPIQETA